MNKRWQTWGLILIASLTLTLGLAMVPGLAESTGNETIDITLLQANDIYEISPVEGGKRGGMARVATVRQQLLAENPHTYTVLAGDAFSPSALGTAKVDGERLAGKQMVAAMNAVGFDYATFGNHEFDISESQFLSRLQESKFRWFSGNVTDGRGNAFDNVPQSIVFEVKGEGSSVARVGLIGVTLESNPAEYVGYRKPNPIQVAQEQAKALRDRVDMLIALTHLTLEQDQQLAATTPEIDLILGGHEHENIQQWRLLDKGLKFNRCGTSGTPIFKADGNARTVYIHHLHYHPTNQCLELESRLQPITDKIPEEPKTAAVVEEWTQQGFDGFRADGFKPEQVVATTTETLDGREVSVRNYSTNLTDLIAQSMVQEVENADLAIFNSGSIRIDDQLPPGEITEYDVIRIMPFGGKILAVNLKGDLLKQVLDQGQANRGTGGYLQTANVTKGKGSNTWLIKGKPLEANRIYLTAINDFLMSGKEQGLNFLSFQNPGAEKVAEKQDVRFALIRELQ